MQDPSAPPAERAQALVGAMSTEDKISLAHGARGTYIGNAYVANKTLGVPPLNMNDGPQGFRGKAGTSTSFPSGLTIGASWDPAVAELWGKTMGVEFAAKGANVQLGPAMCVARVPRNGRNFECELHRNAPHTAPPLTPLLLHPLLPADISGEDPVLGAKMVGPAIAAIQAQGVVANAKHFAMNSQETNRMSISEDVDERTRFEIYYPPFEAAIAAGVGSFMCSYNKINSLWSCENPVTLQHELKEVLGFQGWVMSDWGATHSTSMNAGLDQQMPGTDPLNQWMHSKLAAQVADGTVTMARLDETALRILTPLFAVGEFDHPVSASGSIDANVTSDAHNAVARQLSAASHVLLKNVGGVLPLGASVKRIAVIGKAADAAVVSAGGGSGHVNGPYVISPLHGIRVRANRNASAGACSLEAGTDYYQLLSKSVPASSAEQCCDLCSASAACSFFSFSQSKGACWLKDSDDGRRADASIISGSVGGVLVTYVASDADGAKAAAAAADVAIVVGATSSSEGFDRTSLGLDDGVDALISAVAAVQPKTIVVMSTVGATLTPWRDEVAAIVTNFMPGQEGGNALADVLFGDVNPSAKLPLTFPAKENECPVFSQNMWPGVDKHSNYSEHMLIGYRCYDQHQVAPAFPFGHGLSYTTFALGDLVVGAGSVSVSVQNTGAVAGAEVVQLYLGFPAAAGEPPQQLKHFQKVSLAPGAKQTITFTLADRDTSVWDATAHAWSKVAGDFRVSVGVSSRDGKALKGTFSQ
jgi:beta-glucosidase